MTTLEWNGPMGQVVFQSSREALLVCNDQGHIVLMNPVARAFLEAGAGVEAPGLNVPTLLTLDEADWVEISQGSVLSGSWTAKVATTSLLGKSLLADAHLTPLTMGHFLLALAPSASNEGLFSGSVGLSSSNIPSDLVISALKYRELYMAEEQKARTDALTGLSNRRSFEDALARSLELFKDQGQVFSIVILDVDHFKDFNDTHGHIVGDAVLKGLGSILHDGLRMSDTVHRIGGEEFVILLPGSGKKSSQEIAERTRVLVEQTKISDLRVTVSLGVATCETKGWDATSLVNAADEALYSSKGGGRNRVTHHQDLVEKKPREA